ncbi:hypothetical protein TorRG33x02_282710, partial [Trema orientale]
WKPPRLKSTAPYSQPYWKQALHSHPRKRQLSPSPPHGTTQLRCRRARPPPRTEEALHPETATARRRHRLWLRRWPSEHRPRSTAPPTAFSSTPCTWRREPWARRRARAPARGPCSWRCGRRSRRLWWRCGSRGRRRLSGTGSLGRRWC